MTVARAAGRWFDPADLLARLGDLGPPSELRDRSPALAADTLALDRVLLSTVRDGVMHADALHLVDGDPTAALGRLREAPVRLEYPLVEGEVLRRRRAQVVDVATGEVGGPRAFADVLEWTAYAVAPVVVEGRVIGFFHGDRTGTGDPIDERDATGLASFAACFAVVYERTVLRQRLRVQLREMRQVGSWADARAAELGDRPIELGEDAGGDAGRSPGRRTGIGGEAVRDLLTPRELEVLEHMVRGETNVGIARDLVLSEGTVKFHVKNILRKLHVSNRAEATSRYLHLVLDRGAGESR